MRRHVAEQLQKIPITQQNMHYTPVLHYCLQIHSVTVLVSPCAAAAADRCPLVLPLSATHYYPSCDLSKFH